MLFKFKENFNYFIEDELGQRKLVASYVAGHEYSARTPQMEANALQWAEDGLCSISDEEPKPVINSDVSTKEN